MITDNFSRLTVGMAFGRYDVLHAGHINQLKFAKSFCDFLIVGLPDDKYCLERNKECVNSLEDRRHILESIKYVDATFIYSSHDPLVLWNERKTDIIFLNIELINDPIYLKVLPELEKLTKVIWPPRTDNISSTDIKNKIKNI